MKTPLGADPANAVTATSPLCSIVIPAHNEEAVIRRCLSCILEEATPAEFELVVVCNGCSDHTADLVRHAYPAVKVVETETPSKANALNLGDRAVAAFPRLYVDADIRLSTAAVRAVCETLRASGTLAAAPRMDVDLTGSTGAVRTFYSVWSRHPYFHTAMIGSGVYAVSRRGHERLGAFPEVTADDAYVRLSFREDERATSSASFVVTAPRTLRDLVGIKTRSRRGNTELQRERPDLFTASESSLRQRVPWRLFLAPWRWPALFVYYSVVARTWLRVKAHPRREGIRWERDESSRQTAALAPHGLGVRDA